MTQKETECCKIRTVAADMLEISIEALDKILALEDEPINEYKHLFLRAVSIAGNARRNMGYKAAELVITLQKQKGEIT